MTERTILFEGFAIAYESNPSKNDHSSASTTFVKRISNYLYLKPAVDSSVAWAYRAITAAKAQMYVATPSEGIAYIYSHVLKAEFNPNSLTYNDRPTGTYGGSLGASVRQPGYVDLEVRIPAGAERAFLANGFYVSSYFNSNGDSAAVYNPPAGSPPKLVLTVDDDQIVRMEAYFWDENWGDKSITKSAGVDIQIGGVMTRPSAVCLAEVTTASVSILWRDNAAGAVTELPVEVSGDTLGIVTIPAGTFAGKKQVQVRPKVYSSNLQTYIPDKWLTINLEDATPTATPLSPVDMVVSGTTDITLKWSHSIDTGTKQTRADLQYSKNGTTWSDLATVTGATQTYAVGDGIFSVGENFWRVRTYNFDGKPSEWSTAAKFLCVGAPNAPVIDSVYSTPRPKISWQVEGQQAYQVELVGVYADGTRFGTDKQWQSPLYLADGDYTVRVRVQNEYGFWSAWGVAPLQIINTPGSAITLTAETGREVTLAWVASGFDYYIVYRDGVAIARTTEPLYTDRTSIGPVKYQVRGCYADSANYSLSDDVTVTVQTTNTCLYDLDAGQWVDLRYDASAHRSTAYSLARDIQYMQLSGRTYPVAERSEFVQRSLRVACVCFTAADRARMLSILGHLVCVKTPEGNMVTGYVANLSETSDDFFSTYGFDVAQADVKEEIDIDEA